MLTLRRKRYECRTCMIEMEAFVLCALSLLSGRKQVGIMCYREAEAERLFQRISNLLTDRAILGVDQWN